MTHLDFHPGGKTFLRRDATDKQILAIPIDSNPALADLLEWHTTHRLLRNVLQQPHNYRDLELRSLRHFIRLAIRKRIKLGDLEK
jgi:hypothetical protein